MRGSWRRVLFLLLLVLAWEAASKLGLWRAWIFPSPLAIARSFWDGVVDKTIPLGIAVSMRRLLVGYLISLAGGLGLGLALARSRTLRESIGTVVTGLQALPSICWLPLALLWFGLSETAILFVVVAGSLLSIISGMRLGWTFAWRSLMAGELLFVSGGLGQLLATGRELGDMARVMAVMVAIVSLGLVTEVLFFQRLDARVREVWGTDRA